MQTQTIIYLGVTNCIKYQVAPVLRPLLELASASVRLQQLLQQQPRKQQQQQQRGVDVRMQRKRLMKLRLCRVQGKGLACKAALSASSSTGCSLRTLNEISRCGAAGAPAGANATAHAPQMMGSMCSKERLTSPAAAGTATKAVRLHRQGSACSTWALCRHMLQAPTRTELALSGGAGAMPCSQEPDSRVGAMHEHAAGPLGHGAGSVC